MAGATTSDEARYLFDLMKPQLVIASLHRPWLLLLQRFRSERPAVHFIGLTDSDETAQEARSIGIENIVLTGSDPQSSADGIQLCLGAWLAVPQPSDSGVTIMPGAECWISIVDCVPAAGIARTGVAELSAACSSPCKLYAACRENSSLGKPIRAPLHVAMQAGGCCRRSNDGLANRVTQAFQVCGELGEFAVQAHRSR